MTTLQIDDKLAAALLAQARVRGMSLGRYLQFLVEAQQAPSASTDDDHDSASDFDAAMDELFAGDTRPLPVDFSTHSRRDVYFDHD